MSAETPPMLDRDRPAALLGHRVSFTGRFASITRAHAEALVELGGGTVVANVSPRTTMLVIGTRGWPLMDSGHVTRKLAAAERLRAAGRRLRLVSESTFREMLGLDAPANDEAKSLTAQSVREALGIDRRTLDRWEHCGLVRSRAGRYDFRDLVSLRTVTRLVARGVSPVVIRKSLDALQGLLPGVDRPLSQLNILVSDSGELVAELEEALLTPSGQLEIRFGEAPDLADPDAADPDADAANAGDAAVPVARPDRSRAADPREDAARDDLDRGRPLTLVRADERDSAAWIEAGLEHEEAGDLDQAEHDYRRAAALAPSDPVPQFNLGNILLSGGRLEAAAERFAQAAALDPAHSLAWFNLAHVQDALGDPASALRYLRRATAADPAYADAHYNLADLAERLGDRDTAAAAWNRYLQLDPAGEWSAEARRRLQALRRPAWA